MRIRKTKPQGDRISYLFSLISSILVMLPEGIVSVRFAGWMRDEDKREEIGAIGWRRLPCCRHVPNYHHGLCPSQVLMLADLTWPGSGTGRHSDLVSSVHDRGANGSPAPKRRRFGFRSPQIAPYTGCHPIAQKITGRASDLGFFGSFANLNHTFTLQ